MHANESRGQTEPVLPSDETRPNQLGDTMLETTTEDYGIPMEIVG